MRLAIAALAAGVGLATLASGMCGAEAAGSPEFAAKIPPSIETPDHVRTRIGPLDFRDGAPDEATAERVYDQLDVSRGIEAFLQGMPATSVYAACRGLGDAGVKENHDIGLTEELMDARSLFLTPNTTTVYGFSCLDL